MLPMIDDLRIPRPGKVDPDRCPVCNRLRIALRVCLHTGNAAGARETVFDMQAHMTHGHPDDPRNTRPAPTR